MQSKTMSPNVSEIRTCCICPPFAGDGPHGLVFRIFPIVSHMALTLEFERMVVQDWSKAQSPFAFCTKAKSRNSRVSTQSSQSMLCYCLYCRRLCPAAWKSINKKWNMRSSAWSFRKYESFNHDRLSWVNRLCRNPPSIMYADWKNSPL